MANASYPTNWSKEVTHGESKYWNWYGDDPMPEVAERYYGLLKEANDSFPDEMWDAGKVPGVEHGRYWAYVSVYHICHDGPETSTSTSTKMIMANVPYRYAR